MKCMNIFMNMTWDEWIKHPEVIKRIKLLKAIGWKDSHLTPMLSSIFMRCKSFMNSLKSLDRRIGIGIRVFDIPMLLVGVTRAYSSDTDEFFVVWSQKLTGNGGWRRREDLRVWTKDVADLCNHSRKCWRRYGKRL